MSEQKTRTIFIATLTLLSFFILTSWISLGLLYGTSLGTFPLEILRYGSFAVLLFAFIVCVVMVDWSGSRRCKLIITILHILFVLGALFWIWLLWLADLSGLAA